MIKCKKCGSTKVVKICNNSKKLHEAFILIAEENIDYLSYEGQTKFNELSRLETENQEVKLI